MLTTLYLAVALVALQADDPLSSRTTVTSPLVPGKPVHVTYDRNGGPLEGKDEVFAVATFETDAGQLVRHAPLTEEHGPRLRAEVLAPNDAFFVAVEIVSSDAWDMECGRSAMAVGANGQPLRGARLQQLIQNIGDYRSRIAQEMAAFPNSPSAHRASWFFSSRILAPDVYATEVRAALNDLSGLADAEALSVRSYGHLLLNREEDARALLIRAIQNAPGSRFTARALKDYWYECYSRGLTGGSDEVREALSAALKQAPTSPLARQEVRVLSFHGAAPLEVIESVCRKWTVDDPRNPEPRFVLGRALQVADTRLAEAQQLALECVAGVCRGDARLTGDPTDSMASDRVPTAYVTAARAALQEGRGEVALGFALAAQSTQEDTVATPFELEAQAWEQLERKGRAIDAWQRALKRGSAEAASSISRLGGSTADSKELDENGESVASAPTLELTTLDGRTIVVGGKRSGLLVLNFWGLGCAPCRQEIPDLNEFAESFSSSDVTFVALTQDSAEDVTKFLESHPFAYDQVADARKAAAAFGVDALPLHLIIDQKGQIVGRLVGAGRTNTESLRRIIAAHLAPGH